MRVIHITRWMHYGGTERVILNLCQYSKAEPLVISTQNGKFRKEFEKAGIPLRILHDAKNLFDETILKLIKKANIVHFHYPYIHLMILLRQLGIPHLMTQHGNYACPCPCLMIAVATHIAQIQHPDTVVITIPNGVDTNLFAYKRRGDKSKIILTRVCRPNKCDDYFWSSMQRVLESRANTELWIVGEEGKSTDRIRFLGIRDDVNDILSRTDIFVYTPYPGGGGFDLVTLEAMSVGVPVVTTNVEHVRNSVIDGETGFLVLYGDEEAFANAVLRLVDNAELRYKMSIRAANLAREVFDIRKVVDRYNYVYKKLAHYAHW